ncbi:hypothetical protein SAMN04488038_10728 [Solimonas aquatica]|uniref:Uncharacterized protein n=1 Tax=Solimonas aquatica TaxID=489703 RepID=A0A1H9GD85_9GAMM|nr:hypothetical protein [Solimonas aquatica]SEQ48047.1 hypothetical protein SAMN04488038_10728 [Solimonas aquatica]
MNAFNLPYQDILLGAQFLGAVGLIVLALFAEARLAAHGRTP